MSLESENQRLMAQVEHFSGDEHVRREAAPWRNATPVERLAAAVTLCQQAARFRALWSEDVRRRAEVPDALPPDAIALLSKLHAESLP